MDRTSSRFMGCQYHKRRLQASICEKTVPRNFLRIFNANIRFGDRSGRNSIVDREGSHSRTSTFRERRRGILQRNICSTKERWKEETRFFK